MKSHQLLCPPQPQIHLQHLGDLLLDPTRMMKMTLTQVPIKAIMHLLGQHIIHMMNKGITSGTENFKKVQAKKILK